MRQARIAREVPLNEPQVKTESSPALKAALLETILVVSLLFLLAAFPALHERSDEAVLDARARALVGDVERARSLARERGEEIGVAFEVDRDRYTFVDGRGNELGDLAPRLLPEDMLVEARFASGSTLAFERDGAPCTSGWVDLASGEARRRVWFQWDTTGILIAVR